MNSCCHPGFNYVKGKIQNDSVRASSLPRYEQNAVQISALYYIYIVAFRNTNCLHCLVMYISRVAAWWL